MDFLTIEQFFDRMAFDLDKLRDWLISAPHALPIIGQACNEGECVPVVIVANHTDKHLTKPYS